MLSGTALTELVRKVSFLTNNFVNARDLYMKKHLNFDVERDARITVYSKIIALLEVTSTLFLFRTFNLKTDEWWLEIQKQSRKELDLKIEPYSKKEIIARRVEMVLIYIYFIAFFSSIESSFRILVRTKDKSDDGTGDFPPICAKLLGKEYSKFSELIDLIVPLRNTSFHNNGVYYHKSGKDRSPLFYKGIKYAFRYGEKVDLKDASKLIFFEITSDCLRMMNTIVNSKEISDETEILDPFVDSSEASLIEEHH